MRRIRRATHSACSRPGSLPHSSGGVRRIRPRKLCSILRRRRIESQIPWVSESIPQRLEPASGLCLEPPEHFDSAWFLQLTFFVIIEPSYKWLISRRKPFASSRTCSFVAHEDFPSLEIDRRSQGRFRLRKGRSGSYVRCDLAPQLSVLAIHLTLYCLFVRIFI